MSAAGKLQMLMELLKKKETHQCDHCDQEHEIESGILDGDSPEFKKLVHETLGIEEE